MSSVSYSISNNQLTISLTGKIDSAFCTTFQNEIESKFRQDLMIIFDFHKVEYISSTGLRLILKCTKTCQSCEVINVSNEVFEIFNITGFTSLLNIKRALRELSIDGKRVIGEGAKGSVYQYDNDTVVKAFKSDIKLSEIEHEIMLAKKAFVLGIPTAIPYDVVRIKEGTYGTVYEFLASDVMNKLMIKYPEKKEEYRKLFTNVLKTFHHTKIDEDILPSKKLEVLSWINNVREHHVVDDEVLNRLEVMVNDIIETKTLIHGDFHIKNIMFQGEEPLIIDMDTLSYGHPVFEVALMYYSFVAFDEHNQENYPKFFGFPCEEIVDFFNRTIDDVTTNLTSSQKEIFINEAKLIAYLKIINHYYKYNRHSEAEEIRFNYAREYLNQHIHEASVIDFAL